MSEACPVRWSPLVETSEYVASNYYRAVAAYAAKGTWNVRGVGSAPGWVFQSVGNARRGAIEHTGFAVGGDGGSGGETDDGKREKERGAFSSSAGGSSDSQSASDGGDGSCGSGGVAGEGPVKVEIVSERTLANREKRRKAKVAKQRKRSEASLGCAEVVKVPEWRRKDGVGFHKGVFAECSEETQLALRESRAKMLIAKNKAAVIEAEERERKTAAMLKSRMIEENVEKERLELEKKMKVLRESAAMPQGYCETVLSALATPSLSDGTISPDSSISSAEVHKKDEAIKMLVNQCDEQRKKSEKTELALQEMSRKLEEFRLTSEKVRKEKEDLIRERVRKERENMFAGRHGDGIKAAYESGKREYRGDDGTKIFWNTNADV